jgi:hypothetical protein
MERPKFSSAVPPGVLAEKQEGHDVYTRKSVSQSAPPFEFDQRSNPVSLLEMAQTPRKLRTGRVIERRYGSL